MFLPWFSFVLGSATKRLWNSVTESMEEKVREEINIELP